MTTAPNVTDATRQAARGKIRHAAECHPTAANYVETRGVRGDALLRCTSCRRFYVMAPAPRVATPRPVAAPVAPVMAEPVPVAPEPDGGPQDATPADVEAAANIPHHAGCTATAWRVTDARRDRLVTCSGCGRFAKAGPSAALGELTDELTDAPPPILSRWRCREHPENPVSWRGTGCPACDADHRQRQQARERSARDARRATLDRNTTTSTTDGRK